MSFFQDQGRWDKPSRADQASDEAQAPATGALRRAILAPLGFLGSRFGFLALGAVILAALIYLVGSADSFIKSGELEQEIQKLEHEIAVLEDDNRLLRQKLERLQTDPDYVEDEARKKMGLVRPGEVIYRLSEEPDLSDDPPPAPPPLP